MLEPSEYRVELIRESDEGALYRATRPATPSTILVKIAKQSNAFGLERLENEYSLASELEPSWAVRPTLLTRDRLDVTLFLEDPGGQPLDLLLGSGDLLLGGCIGIAIGAADALSAMHQRGLVHRDVKPGNLFVQLPNMVRLAGFGVASKFTREHPAETVPEIIAGSLEYMAPEQTGRMNRSVDARSDLYALGISLYQMLTGALPFRASDPMEWVHCHIARVPIAPNKRDPDIPEQLSRIVMKLLAKGAEARYQNAEGLAADLRRCQRECTDQKQINLFALATACQAGRLTMPEALYGRQAEIDTILRVFRKVASSQTAELILVTGPAGVGKSAAVQELRKWIISAGGFYATGKFDQFQRDIPYATFALAFQALIRQLLLKRDKELSSWLDALREALGPNGQLMVALIPELTLLLGEQPTVAELSPQDAQARFQTTLRRFIGVFATHEHPLVLFLDDLQWIDHASAELLDHLATHPGIRSLLIVGAYRTNEVDATHPLSGALDRIRAASGHIEEIALSPLSESNITDLVADSISCDSKTARSLSALVHSKTGGNPFFATRFLSMLVERSLLSFDSATQRWQWNRELIEEQAFSDNVVEFMAATLGSLPKQTQRALWQLACLGHAVDIKVLETMLDEPMGEIHESLLRAVQDGLLIRRSSQYVFVHDRVQEAAYALIPEESRAAEHIRLARRLLSHGDVDERTDSVFAVVNHFERGRAHIQTFDEKRRVAELNLIAARRAKSSIAYATAQTHCLVSRDLLGDDRWKTCYDLALRTELNLAECEYLAGAAIRAESRLSDLASRARSLLDLASMTSLWVKVLTILDRTDDAIDVSLQCLSKAGLEWHRPLSEEFVESQLSALWSLIGDRNIASLVESPSMRSEEWRATAEVLVNLSSAAHFKDANLACVTAAGLVAISLLHGNTDASAFGYVWFGQIWGPRSGDYKTGLDLATVGFRLAEERGLRRYQSGVTLMFGGAVLPWLVSLEQGHSVLRKCMSIAKERGDHIFGAQSATQIIQNRLWSGQPLATLQREAEAYLEFAKNLKYARVVDIITVQLALFRTLRGNTRNFGSYDSADFHEAGFEEHLATHHSQGFPRFIYFVYKMRARYLAGDYAAVLSAAETAETLLWTGPAELVTAGYHLFCGLALAAVIDKSMDCENSPRMGALQRHADRISLFADNCPETFASSSALLAAESERVNQRLGPAMLLYEHAVAAARTSGQVHMQALACELAGRFYAQVGNAFVSGAYLAEARRHYLLWDAHGKVRQLDAAFPQLSNKERRDFEVGGTRVSGEQLDVAAIMKAAQALSGEIETDKLIETLMRITLTHAGAERGVLILIHNHEVTVSAEAALIGSEIEVRMTQEAPSRCLLPESAINYMVRTRERILLDDALVGDLFATDEYILKHHPRSLLCLPILKQSVLIGGLYLENRLTAEAFTAGRITVLEFLAAQAAISLENADLYAELRRENAERKRAEQELRRSEAFLAAGQKIGKMGSWTWVVSDDMAHWSLEALRILGLEETRQGVPFAALADLVHPGDRTRFDARLDEAVQQRKPFAIEHRIQLGDGAIKHVHTSGQPFSSSTNALEFIGTISDVTERASAEEALRSSQRDLERMARLTTMGELVVSIAHEVNQPLGAIAANGDAGLRWLNRDPPNLDRVRTSMDAIVQNGLRASEIVARVRDLARKADPARTPVNINKLIREALRLVDRELREHRITLRLRLDDSVPSLLCDPIQMQQVTINLVMNACESMSTTSKRERVVEITNSYTEKREVVVVISDTGPGIDPQVAGRLFESFFSTKKNGLGVGLSICRSIVEAHGGHISAHTNNSGGATFRFNIPVSADAPS